MTGRIGRRSERPRRRPGLRRIGQPVGPETGACADNAGAGQNGAPEGREGAAASGLSAGYIHSRITRAAMLAFARETYNVRRRRGRFLPADLFGEPTWDILLDLYVATRENRPVPTTSACIGAHVPPTTALRWLRILENKGLVERQEDGRDGRRTFVRLSHRGIAAMEEWLHATLVTLDLAVGPVMRDGGPLAEAAE